MLSRSHSRQRSKASGGHTVVVQNLLNKDADANMKNEEDWTALMYAASQPQTSIAVVARLNHQPPERSLGKGMRKARMNGLH
ncbi:MAG: ankyrin repeat domain-containing protein [Pyrinomonadaceae bacterium]